MARDLIGTKLGGRLRCWQERSSGGFFQDCRIFGRAGILLLLLCVVTRNTYYSCS